jgi:SAM-dependent methyltransferase
MTEMGDPNQKIWTTNEAEAWNLDVPRSQTVREVGFLIWAFRRFGHGDVHEVLDLGCGTGRLAIELSAKGYAVTGVDKFPAMLEVARQNAEAKHVKLSLFRTPLDELKITGQFDAAYSIQDPFNYVLEEEELSNSLTRLRSLLQPGGVLVVDMMNFASLYGRWKETIIKDNKGDGWSVHRRVSHRVDDVNMLWYHSTINRMELGGRTKQWKETHVLRMWTFPEFRSQLIAHGFSNIHLFGELKAGTKEATTHAHRLVTVATKSPA